MQPAASQTYESASLTTISRQLYATMTIKNDLDTLNLLPELTSKSVEQIAKVKGITYVT